jgi:hypothetical protein
LNIGSDFSPEFEDKFKMVDDTQLDAMLESLEVKKQAPEPAPPVQLFPFTEKREEQSVQKPIVINKPAAKFQFKKKS